MLRQSAALSHGMEACSGAHHWTRREAYRLSPVEFEKQYFNQLESV
jgi:hypothetical protein